MCIIIAQICNHVCDTIQRLFTPYGIEVTRARLNSVKQPVVTKF
jgi:hypothetical protein